MERTTIRLPEPLLKDTKRFAAAAGKSMTAVIEDALRVWLARKPRTKRRYKFTTVGGDGVLPNVNLDSNAELLELMEPAEELRRQYGIKRFSG
jgi:hypothetical protein